MLTRLVVSFFLPGIGILPDICANLNSLGSNSISPLSNRILQSGGALCHPNVLEVAREISGISTMVKLLELADLSEIFSCAGPFTLLAPTNAAFDSLDPNTIQELLLPANEKKLQDLLLYHIIPALYLSSDLKVGPLDTLLRGETVEVTLNPIMFNGRAGVVSSDNIACNGVIYVINDVLVPSKFGWRDYS